MCANVWERQNGESARVMLAGVCFPCIPGMSPPFTQPCLPTHRPAPFRRPSRHPPPQDQPPSMLDCYPAPAARHPPDDPCCAPRPGRQQPVAAARTALPTGPPLLPAAAAAPPHLQHCGRRTHRLHQPPSLLLRHYCRNCWRSQTAPHCHAQPK